VEVPLPLRLGVTELPVVSDELGFAELAAGSPVADPAPPGAPLCAFAKEPPSASAAASAIVGSFMAIPLRMIMNSEIGKPGSTAFQDDPVAKVDGFCKQSQPASNRLPSRALQSTAV
jgi:hypothetical protein